MDILKFLYETKPGRIILRPLINRPVSWISGIIMDSRLSKLLIPAFVKHNHINCDDYVLDDINSFNDFFCRRIKNGLRNISFKETDFISPCDALLSIKTIKDGRIYSAKQSSFTIASLLRDRRLAKTFEDGYMLVFRLCVDHYHRYIYIDSGQKYKDRRINGFYHTVRPVAIENFPVFIENTREYSIINTDNFGRCVQMEVGALLVGRIVNNNSNSCRISRGYEKGHFEYGGSTIIVLVKKNRLRLLDRFIKIIDSDKELPVKMGETLGDRESEVH